MSKKTENIMQQMLDYLEEHQNEIHSEEDTQRLAQAFMRQHNEQLMMNGSDEPETANDYLELAEEASSKKQALEYVKKAIELEPANLDALRMEAEMTARNPSEMLEILPSLLQIGKNQMEEEGCFPDGVGDFWLLLETRPYMRLRYLYFQTLIECGMMHPAIAEGEKLLELCTNDNLGVRYDLAKLYAYLEEEAPLLKLMNQQEYDKENSQMLLALSAMYYKLNQPLKALDALQKLSQANKDTKKFFRLAAGRKMDELDDTLGPYGYRPNTIEELAYTCIDGAYLYDTVPYFFKWAYNMLKTSKK